MKTELKQQDIFDTFSVLLKRYPEEHRELLKKHTGSKFDAVNLKDAVLLGLTENKGYFTAFDVLVNNQLANKKEYSQFAWGSVISLAGGLVSGVLGGVKSKQALEAQRIRLEAENKAKAQRTLMIAVVGGLFAIVGVGFLIYTKNK